MDSLSIKRVWEDRAFFKVGLLNEFGKSLMIIDMPGTGQKVLLKQ